MVEERTSGNPREKRWIEMGALLSSSSPPSLSPPFSLSHLSPHAAGFECAYSNQFYSQCCPPGGCN